ncbi:MAG: hypothetical protein GTO41_05985, partial [Burkholderiales bacterium]|nr:hypothetical protein [Burkholderiales bacterium]
IGAILKEIARRLEVELSYSDDLVKAMRQPVTVQVDKVPYKELIEQTLRDSGLIFELTGDKLIIRRK